MQGKGIVVKAPFFFSALHLFAILKTADGTTREPKDGARGHRCLSVSICGSFLIRVIRLKPARAALKALGKKYGIAPRGE